MRSIFARLAIGIASVAAASVAFADASIPYQGRLTDANGQGVAQAVLTIRIFDMPSATTPSVTIGPLNNVVFRDGVFAISLGLTEAQLDVLFAAGKRAQLQILATLPDGTVLTLPKQELGGVPLAMRVPVGTGLKFNADGKLVLDSAVTLPVADGTPGQVLVTDGSGNLGWAAPSGGGGSSNAATLNGRDEAFLRNAANLNAGVIDDARIPASIARDSEIPTIPTSLPPNGTAGGALTGTYPNPNLADNAVTNAKLADNAVGPLEIIDNAVTNAKLADNAVNTAELADNAITNAKLADNAVNTAEIADNAITVSKLAPGVGGVPGIASAADSNAVTIDASERVGIGTTAPSAALHVSQSASSVSTVVENTSTSIDAATNLTIRARNAASEDRYTRASLTIEGGHSNVGVGNDNDATAAIDFYARSSVMFPTTKSFKLGLRPAANSLNLFSDLVYENGGVMTWMRNGNVGIGTTTPQETLDVNGSLTTKNTAAGLTVTTGGWAATTPTSLSNATDGDEATSAGEGCTSGSGNTGHLTIDLGAMQRGLAFFKVGLRNALGGDTARWKIEASPDGSWWVPGFDTTMTVGATERVVFPSAAFWGRYIRFLSVDLGTGQACAKLYEVYTKQYR